MIINLKKKKIWLTSDKGMVGSAIARAFKKKNIRYMSTNRNQLNLIDQKKVFKWVKNNRPNMIFLTSAKVGGIYANDTYPGNFIYENIQIQSNIIEASRLFNVEKLIFLGSSCIYPKNSKQPIKEEYLLSGELEKTNQWYAVAKISGIKMIQAYKEQYGCNFISLMPCNMYGPNDNYHPLNSHVLAALIRKFVLAKKQKKNVVEIWGSGKPLREFMHVDDFAEATIFASKKYNSSKPINVGTGEEINIKDLALLIAKISEFKGKIVFNKNYPDGTKRKILNSNKIKKIGWRPRIKLKDGIKKTIKNFINESISNITN